MSTKKIYSLFANFYIIYKLFAARFFSYFMYIKYEKDKIIGGLKKLEIIYLTKKKNFTHLVICLLVDGRMVATFASSDGRISCLVVDDLWSFFFLLEYWVLELVF